MKKLFAAAALLLATVAQAQAPAAESNWEVRFRAVQAIWQHKSDAINAGAIQIPKNDSYVSNKVLPEVDISYILNPYLSAELILTYPQRLDVYASSVRLGTIDALPPVLTLQGRYPIGPVTPYLGVGANLTLVTSQKLGIANVGSLKVNDTSFGFAGQAGFDVALPLGIILNVDVKYVQIATDVKAKSALTVPLPGGGTTTAPAGTKLTKVEINPLLIGVGVAYKF